jgi:hypothetical protein
VTKWLQFFVADTQEEFHGGLFEAEKFGKISGFYMASQGAGGFAAASFRDIDEVRRGIRHEVQGHFALNTCAHGEKRAVVVSTSTRHPTLRVLECGGSATNQLHSTLNIAQEKPMRITITTRWQTDIRLNAADKRIVVAYAGA